MKVDLYETQVELVSRVVKGEIMERPKRLPEHSSPVE